MHLKPTTMKHTHTHMEDQSPAFCNNLGVRQHVGQLLLKTVRQHRIAGLPADLCEAPASRRILYRLYDGAISDFRP